MNTASKPSFVLSAIFLCLGTMASAELLESSEWKPVEMAGNAIDPSTEAFLRFEADRAVAGHGGCNSLQGRFVTNDAAIQISPFASTLRTCVDNVYNLEFEMLGALDKTRGYVREGTKLEFFASDGNSVLKLQQTDAD